MSVFIVCFITFTFTLHLPKSIYFYNVLEDTVCVNVLSCLLSIKGTWTPKNVQKDSPALCHSEVRLSTIG